MLRPEDLLVLEVILTNLAVGDDGHLRVVDPAVADDVLRWRTLPDTETRLAHSAVGTPATWTGRPTVPDDDAELRLLVVEEERLFADGAEPGSEVITTRVVYAAAASV